jgi:DNA-directed RNA polymerase II subunit RPB2
VPRFHLRRISTNIDKNSKLIQPGSFMGRMGVFCPAETPEGHNVGFVKNMSIGALVTVATDTWRSNGSYAELD